MELHAMFSDSVILAYLIIFYIPARKIDFIMLNDSPSTEEHIKSNAAILVASLHNIFDGEPIKALKSSSIYNGKIIESILLLSFLYESLPSFIPKETIEFGGILHHIVKRSWDVSNSSNRSITFNAYIIGSTDFKVEQKHYTISPKSTATLSVEFQSRFYKDDSAVLVLKSQKLGFRLSSIIAYRLVSKVKIFEPQTQDIHEIEATLYCNPPAKKTISVKNIFEMDCLFQIYVQQCSPVFSCNNSKGIERIQTPPAFSVDTEIFIKSRGATDLSITFAPFQVLKMLNQIGAHVCEIRFYNYDYGEFTLKVIGMSKLPNPTETLSWSCITSENFERELHIQTSNRIRDTALLSHFNLSKKFKKDNSIDPRTKVDKISEIFRLPKLPLTYHSEFSNNAVFSCNPTIVLEPNESKVKSQLLVRVTPKVRFVLF